MASWLSRQRKTDLLELADTVGFKEYDGLRKAELETELDEYIAKNSARWADEPKLAPYFASRTRVTSPIKKEAPLLVSRRRPIRGIAVEDSVDHEDEEEEDEPTSAASSSALVRTPGRALSLASRINLPATPADVAQAVDRNALAMRERVVSIYQESGIIEARQVARESLSTVASVLLAVAAFELLYLRPELLPNRHAFTVPATPRLGLSEDYPVYVPDLFCLLSPIFWSPALTWALTSLLLPALVGYFFNLSAASKGPATGRGRRPAGALALDYAVDPLTFSIAKAVATYVVYAQGATFGGLLDPISISRINGALYSGWQSVLAGCAITGLVSVYGAVLKK